MPKTYRRTFRVRFFNRLMRVLIGLGLAPKGMYMLAVRGRKSGRLYATPVTLIEADGQRWLVSPYGEMAWVQNARAAGEVSLSRGGRTETRRITELPPPERAAVLKRYLKREPITRPYFKVPPDAPVEAFVAEGPDHPVFLIR